MSPRTPRRRDEAHTLILVHLAALALTALVLILAADGMVLLVRRALLPLARAWGASLSG